MNACSGAHNINPLPNLGEGHGSGRRWRRCATRLPASVLEPDDLLPLLAKAFDAKGDDVARLEPHRRLHAERDTGRRSGRDDVTRLEHEKLRAVPDDVLDIEDHRLRVAALALLAVHVEPHVELLDVGDLVLGDEPRSERAEGLAALALGPLAAALGLEVAFRDVVANAITRDDIERVLLGQVAPARTDHDCDLTLVIEFGRALRDHRVVVRSDDAVRRLLEDDGLLRDRRPGFGSVVGVIETDGHEVTRVADARAKPRASLHGRQLGQVGLLDFGEALGRERLARNVGHDLREVADLAVLVDDAWLFAAGRAEADELHVSP